MTFYAINVMFDNVQALQAELYVQEVYDDNILDMNTEAVKPLCDAFYASVAEVLELAKDGDQLYKEGIPSNSAYWSSFLSNMKDTQSSIAQVMQKVEDQTPLSHSNTLIPLPGECSLSAFDAGISAMIEDYNKFITY